MSRIQMLLVDDDRAFRDGLVDRLDGSGYEVECAGSAAEARDLLRHGGFQLAALNLRLPDANGLDLLAEIREHWPDTEVLMLSEGGLIDDAVRAMKLGAADCVRKPPLPGRLEEALGEALRKRRREGGQVALEREVERLRGEPQLIGVSAPIRELLTLIGRVAPTECTVLIRGESGAGKELVARALHRESPRGGQPFVVVDCAALHENLLQNELFGHERGAYTGAARATRGLFEVADGGTIFLDEIAEVTPALQTRVLRVLESGAFRRVGGTAEIRVDVRVIAATNRALEPMLEAGQFREDLYYRLNVFCLHVPALRDRREDIPPLVEYFVRNSPIVARRGLRVAPAAMEALGRYGWPGNVRELRNVIERAMILCDGGVLEPAHLPLGLQHLAEFAGEGRPDHPPTLDEIARSYIRRVLEDCRGHRRRAADVLGISERNLYRKLKELSAPRRHDAEGFGAGSAPALMAARQGADDDGSASLS